MIMGEVSRFQGDSLPEIGKGVFHALTRETIHKIKIDFITYFHSDAMNFECVIDPSF